MRRRRWATGGQRDQSDRCRVGSSSDFRQTCSGGDPVVQFSCTSHPPYTPPIVDRSGSFHVHFDMLTNQMRQRFTVTHSQLREHAFIRYAELAFLPFEKQQLADTWAGASDNSDFLAGLYTARDVAKHARKWRSIAKTVRIVIYDAKLGPRRRWPMFRYDRRSLLVNMLTHTHTHTQTHIRPIYIQGVS